MVELKIDGITLKVPHETTVMEAARLAGIGIPSMCFKNGHQNHPSCMICLVKDLKTGNLFPSCAMRVSGNMDISTRDEDVAFRASMVPGVATYLVSPARRPSIAASLMLFGVSKSGSPVPKATTSAPSFFSAAARAATARVELSFIR